MAQLRRDFIDQLRKKDFNQLVEEKRARYLLDSQRSTFDIERDSKIDGSDITDKLVQLNLLIAQDFPENTIYSFIGEIMKLLESRFVLKESEMKALQKSRELFDFASATLSVTCRHQRLKMCEQLVIFFMLIFYCMLPEQITGMLGLSVLIGDFISCLEDFCIAGTPPHYKKGLLQLLGNLGIANPSMISVLERNNLTPTLENALQYVKEEKLYESVVFLSGVILLFGENLTKVDSFYY